MALYTREQEKHSTLKFIAQKVIFRIMDYAEDLRSKAVHNQKFSIK